MQCDVHIATHTVALQHGIDEERCLIGGSRASVQRCCCHDQDSTSGNSLDSGGESLSSIQGRKGLPSLMQPGDRVRIVCSERHDKMVSSQLLAIDSDGPAGRIDALDVPDHDLDPSSLEHLQRAGDLVRSALPGHHPEVRGSKREVGLPVDEDHPVATIQATAEPVGSRNASDPAAKDENCLGRARLATGH